MCSFLTKFVMEILSILSQSLSFEVEKMVMLTELNLFRMSYVKLFDIQAVSILKEFCSWL